MLSLSMLDHNSRLHIAAVVLAILAAQPVCAQTELNCPSTIDVVETAAPVSGWQSGRAVAKHKFERTSILNGKNGGQEYDLAPDGEKQDHGRVTQIWHLAGYRNMNIFLRCRYAGTQLVMSKDIPAHFQNCTLSFTIDKSGNITGTSSFACR
jgi:hypothetical protein